MESDLCEVIITAPDAGWLAAFTRRLVDQRLCAGSHTIETIRAIYRWDDQIHDHPEARVALHTRVELVPQIVALADREHPYKVPCVIALPIVAANPTYAQWIREETRAP